MIPLIKDNKNSLIDLCHKYSVKRLYVFGSAANDSFDRTQSDIDFIVEFEESPPGEHAFRYFGLLSALQDLFFP